MEIFENFEVSDTDTEDSVDEEETVLVSLGAWITFGSPEVKSLVWEDPWEFKVLVVIPEPVLVLEVINNDVGNQFAVLDEDASDVEDDDFDLVDSLELVNGLKVEVGNWPMLRTWEVAVVCNGSVDDAAGEELMTCDGLEYKLVSAEEVDGLEDSKEVELLDSDKAEVALEGVAEANDKVWLKMLAFDELLVILWLYELASELNDELSELAEETL